MVNKTSNTTAKDGVRPRQYTMDAWESTFLSWSIVDQENALRTLATLHKHAKRGRLGPVAQTDAQPAKQAPAPPQPVLDLSEALQPLTDSPK